MRTSPNVVITGTPGVGKTIHCEQLAQETGLRHLSINQFVKHRECHEGFDEELRSYIVDEDKVLHYRIFALYFHLTFAALALQSAYILLTMEFCYSYSIQS